jgi:hypothetical protein
MDNVLGDRMTSFNPPAVILLLLSLSCDALQRRVLTRTARSRVYIFEPVFFFCCAKWWIRARKRGGRPK